MIRKTLFALTALATFAIATPASADDYNDRPSYNYLGVDLSLGAPYSLGASLVIRPVDPLRFEVGFTGNGLVGGGRFGFVVDSSPRFIGPSFSLETGYLNRADCCYSYAPTFDNHLAQSLFYTSALVGLEIGRRAWYRFYVRGGLTTLDWTHPLLGENPNTDLALTGKVGISAFF